MRSSTYSGQDDGVDFEDDRAMLSKDAQTRRKYLKWFNKRRDNFETDKDYDDYLEMVEDIIYNLVHEIDVEATKARVDKYRRENADVIGLNQARRLEEDRAAAERVAEEERVRLARLAEVRAEDAELEKKIARAKRIAQAEELVRVSQGEEEYRKLVRKREKRDRRERKKARREAAAERNETVDTQPQWFRPCFPSALPTVISAPGADKKSAYAIPDDESQEATAGGFSCALVRQRAELEFDESFALGLQVGF